MDKPHVYEIRIEGQLPDRWSDWFDGLAICTEADDQTVLAGLVADQSALYGLLAKIHALNLTLISVIRRSTNR
jgi:hypothetical protein